MSSSKSNWTLIETGDLEAIKILWEPKYRDELRDHELEFVEKLQTRKYWTLKQEEWLVAIWDRVMA